MGKGTTVASASEATDGDDFGKKIGLLSALEVDLGATYLWEVPKGVE